MSESWRIRLACCGMTSPSKLVLIVRLFQCLMYLQLRFKEGNWVRRIEKPGRYRAHQYHAAVPLLHQLLPKGIGSSFPLVLTFSEPSPRLFTKSRQNISVQRRVFHWHFNASSTIYRPLINPLVCTTLRLMSWIVELIVQHPIRHN